MKTKTKQRFAVAYLKNGKFSTFIYRRLKRNNAVELAGCINEQLAGSALMAVAIPDVPRLKAHTA